MPVHAFHIVVLASALFVALAGCRARPDKFQFNNAIEQHYHQVATQIEYPDVNRTPNGNEAIGPPIVLSMDQPPVYWEVTLEEAVHMTLENSRVLRDLGGLLLRSPETTQSIHGPAIQVTDPRFGVDAALSAFDAVFSAQAIGGKNDRPLNTEGGPNTPENFVQDITLLESEVQKRAATGSIFSLRHILDYDANSTPTNRFPTIWNANFEGEFRQPLLQGAGVQYNRIAGFNGVPGFANGVLVARVNTDISLAEFELGVRDLVSNVENAYWDLYFAYRDLEAKRSARDAALESWRRVHALYVAGRRGGEAEREAEAREQYFRFEEELQNALVGRLFQGTQTNNGSSGGTFRGMVGVHLAERRLRLLMGLPINDGRLIRPADEPPLAKVVFDWEEVTREALVRRAELRRQKWVIKRREMELAAARNYLLPQLDAVGLYRWRGMGDTLIAPSGVPLDRFDEAYNNLLNGYYQEWQLGMEFSMPFGFRRGHAAVRNAQLVLARERALLDEQEREVLLGLSNAIAEVDRAWNVAQTNYNRRQSARERYAAVVTAFENDQVDLDLVLDAQRRMSEADTRYFATLSEYALAIKNVHFEKGSLLDYNEVYLTEGPWPAKAYDDAATRMHRNRPVWPLNYIFKHGPVISRGAYSQQTQQTQPAVAPGPELIPLPAPDATPAPEKIEPSSTNPPPTSSPEEIKPAAAQVMVSDTASNPPPDGSNSPPLRTPGGVRTALRSAIWPPKRE